ncbi:MAG: copper oxidase [Anaerolineaceae bacterium]|nr:copper oxidase [Anaerolineaceae bacterium]
MRKTIRTRKLNRRDFMKLGGGVLAGAALTRLLPRTLGQSGMIALAEDYSQVAAPPADLALVGTDGWIYLPGEVPIPGTINQFYQPDDYAPDLLTTYMFGFRDVTGLTDELVFAQKMKCQATAPLFWVNEGQEYRVKLTNVGLQMRPDLIDEHTLHWHGFRNAWPIFDGEPHSSVRVPIGRSLTMYYQPFHPGTYMYHCHVEETEHVHMGMTGSVFVRPAQDGTPIVATNGKTYDRFAYNCGDGSTGFDREFVLNLTDVWAEAHWADSHVQLPDWTDFNADYYLLNGRVYPDTIAPNGIGLDTNTGILQPPPGRPELQYQPLSSLIECEAGDRVLLRLINLTFGQHAMTLPGLKMRVVGKDATLLRGNDGTDFAYDTHTVYLGTGATVDAIFTAPEDVTETQTYLFYNRNFDRLSNAGGQGYGGQMTEIRVHPAGTLAPQTEPNTNPRL